MRFPPINASLIRPSPELDPDQICFPWFRDFWLEPFGFIVNMSDSGNQSPEGKRKRFHFESVEVSNLPWSLEVSMLPELCGCRVLCSVGTRHACRDERSREQTTQRARYKRRGLRSWQRSDYTGETLLRASGEPSSPVEMLSVAFPFQNVETMQCWCRLKTTRTINV